MSGFEAWLTALERRHLDRLTFQEVRRGVQALSSLYVQRRAGLARGDAFAGAGKRAAYALFFGPLRYLLVERLLDGLAARDPARILDLGCGTGAAGAAWGVRARAEVEGLDRSAWAVEEARWTLRQLGVRGVAARGELLGSRWPRTADAIVVAYTVNELDESSRAGLLRRLIEARGRGTALLVVEPIAHRHLTWWDGWAETFKAEGGRADTWRFPIELPEPLAAFDRAAGLDHRELTARSLYLG